MKTQKRKIYDFNVLDLAFGGKGMAKPDGFPVFIEGALPGDTVSAKVVKKKKGYAEARLVCVRKKSYLRGHALCRYADYCGGCKWQDLAYSEQLLYKKRHVAESLDHIGGLKDAAVKKVIPSDNIYHYRNKMEFTCTPSRWLLPEEINDPEIKKGCGIGLHVPGTFSKVIDIETCLLMPQLGNFIMSDVRTFIKKSRLPVYDLKTHEGFWRFLVLRHARFSNRWMVNIVTAYKNSEVLIRLAEMLKEKYSEIDTVVNNITARKAGVAVGEKEIPLAGKPFITEQLGPYKFEISANSFFQTNSKTAEKLYSVVSDYANLTGKERVMDLYSGTGTIPIWLSAEAEKIIGVEIVEDAVADARRNALMNNIDNIDFIAGDIRGVLQSMNSRADVVIIDPPRAGMHKDVLKEVIRSAPGKIIYVSCNPATLSRDLAELTKAYRLCEVQPVDMFPHTPHIECVSYLEKR